MLTARPLCSGWSNVECQLLVIVLRRHACLQLCTSMFAIQLSPCLALHGCRAPEPECMMAVRYFYTCMTSLKDSAIRNMPGTAPLLLLSGQPVSFLKLLRRLGQMAVGVDMLTCSWQSERHERNLYRVSVLVGSAALCWGWC